MAEPASGNVESDHNYEESGSVVSLQRPSLYTAYAALFCTD